MIDFRLKQMAAGCEHETLIAVRGNIIYSAVKGSRVYALTNEANKTHLYLKEPKQSVKKYNLFRARPGARGGTTRARGSGA